MSENDRKIVEAWEARLCIFVGGEKMKKKMITIPGPIRPSAKPVSKAEFERYKKAAEEKKKKRGQRKK